MLKLAQIIGLSLMGTMLLSSAPYALECPKPEEFKSFVQLPPFSFNPQKKQIRYFGVAVNYDLNDDHVESNHDWIMIMDTKVSLEQSTENLTEELISNLDLYHSTPIKFSVIDGNSVSYCLYQSNVNPTLGAIAYHLPKGSCVKSKAHLENFVRSVTQK